MTIIPDARGNAGHWNVGDHNAGHCNTGDYNAGHWNAGHCNTGNCNTGHWNAGHYNTGWFNTTTQKEIQVFNSTMVNRIEFANSLPSWLWNVNPTKDGDPIAMGEAYAKAWEESDKDTETIESMPGFDYDVWVKITGIAFREEAEPEECPPPETITIEGRTYRLEGK